MEPPTLQTTLITRIIFQTREKSVAIDISPTPEAITLDDTENSLTLHHVILFKTLKNLRDDGIKLAMEAQLTARQNKFI